MDKYNSGSEDIKLNNDIIMVAKNIVFTKARERGKIISKNILYTLDL